MYLFKNRKNIIPYFSGAFFLFIITAFLFENHLFKVSVFSLLVIALAIMAIFSAKRCLLGRFKLKKMDFAILAGLLFSGIWSRIYKISLRPINLVEDVPIGKFFGYALESEGFISIVDDAAREMQPPLDFFIETFFLFLFGKNEWGARFHSFLFGVLSILAIYLLLKFLTRSRILAALGSYLLLIHHLLIIYSQEGRPYSTAVFFTILYLLSLANYYLKNQGRDSLYFVFSVQTLYLFVIGMQPPIIIILVAIISSIFFSRRLRLRPFLGAVSASLLLYAPYLVNIMSWGSYLKPFFKVTEGARMFSFLEALQVIVGDYIGVTLFTSLCLLAILGYKKYSKKEISSSDLFFLLLIFLFVFFIISVILSFHIFIDWFMQEQYFVAAIPIAITLLIITLNKLEVFRRPQFNWPLRLSLCSVILILSFKSVKNIPNLYADELSAQSGWKGVYSYLRRESSVQDIAFNLEFFCCNPIDGWFLPGMLLHDVYMPDHGKKTAHVYSGHSGESFYDMFINMVSEEKKSTKKIFFHFPNPSLFEDEYIKGRLRLKERLTGETNILGDYHETVSSQTVIKILVKDSVVKTLNIFFKEMEVGFDVSAYTHQSTVNSRDYFLIHNCYLKPLYFILGYLGVKLNDMVQAKRYFGKLEKIDQGDLRKTYMKDYNIE